MGITDDKELRQRVLAEQVALMCRLSTIPLVGSIVIGAIMAYAVSVPGSLTSIGWYVATIVIMVVRLTVARRFLRRPRTHAEVVTWRRAMLILVGVFGAIWSIPPGFLLPSDPEREIIMSVMFIGATATGIGSLAPVRHAYAILLVPFTLPYGVNQFLLGGDRMLIGFAFLLYLPVMIAIAHRQTDSVERQIRLAFENDELVDALRREHDVVKDTNRELQVQLEQQRQSAERIRKLNIDLERQAIELRNANKDLEGFSYSVSHDLRAPLRAIDGFSHLLEERKGGIDAPDSKHYVQRIRENIARMSLLIDDLLAFARCGRQSIEMVDLEMNDLVRTATSDVLSTRTTQSKSDIAIEHLPRARGDRGLMLQVWVNLLDNAVKYSSKSAQSKIVIRGREEEERTVYEVSDNGVGFDSRYSERLFGVFQRLHKTQEYPGTGVGLAIVHRIVTRHGGDVWAHSEVGRGATFGFALPKSTVEPTRSENSKRVNALAE